jgi:hypothetical protein
MMTEWYQKAIDALQLNGLGERTPQAIATLTTLPARS